LARHDLGSEAFGQVRPVHVQAIMDLALAGDYLPFRVSNLLENRYPEGPPEQVPMMLG